MFTPEEWPSWHTLIKCNLVLRFKLSLWCLHFESDGLGSRYSHDFFCEAACWGDVNYPSVDQVPILVYHVPICSSWTLEYYGFCIRDVRGAACHIHSWQEWCILTQCHVIHGILQQSRPRSGIHSLRHAG